MNASANEYILAADIGATNTRVALVKVGGDARSPEYAANFKGEEYAGLVDILRVFLKDKPVNIRAASIGAAGPVVEDRIKLTNLPWIVDASDLRDSFGWKHVWLMNDLQAIANAVPVLKGSDLHKVKDGTPVKGGTIVVVAPGTGLGIGYLTWSSGRYHAHATEGGHADFAPVNALQDELLSWLRPRFPQVAVEHVCSGIGLPNVYEFLKATDRGSEPAWLADALAKSDDKTPVIVDAAMEGKPGSELCQQALEIFVDVLAAEAGSLALSFGATGGVYLGGGIPPRILPALQRYNLDKSFVAKTGYEYYLERFPIHVILNTDAGILGAAAFANQELLHPDSI